MLSRQIIGPIAMASISKSMVKPVSMKFEISQEVMDRLNQRDTDLINTHYRKSLSQWTPLKSYVPELEFINESILFDLDFIRIMYKMPLMEHHKLHVRQRIFEIYKKAKTDIEKEMIHSVLMYYKLLE